MANACVPLEAEAEPADAAKNGGLSPDLGALETKKGLPPDRGAAGFNGPFAAE